ncbi:PLP-dependent aminotransferase family protein [Ideonella sp. YS5]|uniref:MocR-like pyridoxine biosynthesis transcription factor PdxR n=1 Tax=Ideonella sp. YS5 TaxID=3453714 RepID=UPI003EE8C421
MEPVFPFDIGLPARGEGLRMQALHQQLRAAILDGRLAAGHALPSTRQAAAGLGLGRNTVVHAYDLLMAEGYVLQRPGAKAVVAELASARRSARPVKPVRAAAVDATELVNPMWADAALQREAPRQLPERCFRLGVPEHRLFPHETWRRLVARSLRDWSRKPFAYPPTQGVPALREAIAQHLAFARAVACVPDDVVVTSGAQQAFDLLGRLLVTPGQTVVAVEEPGYPPLRAAFVAAGARLVPVPVDEDGMLIERLPAEAKVIVVTPSHQSPTGVALSLRRRMALLSFARERGAVVLEDDYDGEFRFGARPLDALQTLDRDGRVFYIGTFSKSLFPSLRKGFVVTPSWARESLLRVKHCADSHCDTITQHALAAFIGDGHLARHVRRMRPVYAQRREALQAGLRKELADWLEPIPCEAGLHLSARIRDPRQGPAIVAAMRQHTPGAQAIAEYAMHPRTVPWALTFGYGVIDADEIGRALRRLRRAMPS